MSGVRIVVADDHALFREGVVSLFDRDGRLNVVGEASNGAEAVHRVSELRPDVLLLDVSMPGQTCSTTVRAVRRASPLTRVAVLTMHDDAVLRRALADSGAAESWSKAIAAGELIDGIVALSTAPVMAPVVTEAIPAGLSQRECEVLRLLGSAHSNRAIGAQLHIAEGTVKRHLNSIFRKLGATSRMEAVRTAERLGVIPRV